MFDTTEPAYRSESLVVCGLNSVRPWRHQGGRLAPARLHRVAETFRDGAPPALRIVALHHHLAGAPWRASRKFPLKHRDQVLAALATAGAELVVGGHIHQGAVTVRREFEVLGDAFGAVVLATAPGLGRPRPHRPVRPRVRSSTSGTPGGWRWSPTRWPRVGSPRPRGARSRAPNWVRSDQLVGRWGRWRSNRR